MKPHKESLAYAEKMRKTKRRRKEVGELESGKIKFSELGEYIRSTSEFQKMQGVMGIGAAVIGWENSYSAQDAAYTQAITNGVSSENYEALKAETEKVRAELAQAKSALKESHEIIEALAADMEDIGNLKEENARLRIIGCLKVKASEPEVKGGPWIEWGGKAHPVMAGDKKYEVFVCGNDHAPEYTCIATGVEAREFRWHPISGGRSITKYRLIG